MSKDLKGQRFGRLVVLESAGVNRVGHMRWKCECDCGNQITISEYALFKKGGGRRSCGCIVRKDLYRGSKNDKARQETKRLLSIPVDKSKFNDDWMFHKT